MRIKNTIWGEKLSGYKMSKGAIEENINLQYVLMCDTTWKPAALLVTVLGSTKNSPLKVSINLCAGEALPCILMFI